MFPRCRVTLEGAFQPPSTLEDQCLKNAAAAFSTKHAAEQAIKAIATEDLGGCCRFGGPANPHEVVHVLEDIRSMLRSKEIEFLDPLPEETYGNYGLPRRGPL